MRKKERKALNGGTHSCRSQKQCIITSHFLISGQLYTVFILLTWEFKSLFIWYWYTWCSVEIDLLAAWLSMLLQDSFYTAEITLAIPSPISVTYNLCSKQYIFYWSWVANLLIAVTVKNSHKAMIYEYYTENSFFFSHNNSSISCSIGSSALMAKNHNQMLIRASYSWSDFNCIDSEALLSCMTLLTPSVSVCWNISFEQYQCLMLLL